MTLGKRWRHRSAKPIIVKKLKVEQNLKRGSNWGTRVEVTENSESLKSMTRNSNLLLNVGIHCKKQIEIESCPYAPLTRSQTIISSPLSKIPLSKMFKSLLLTGTVTLSLRRRMMSPRASVKDLMKGTYPGLSKKNLPESTVTHAAVGTESCYNDACVTSVRSKEAFSSYRLLLQIFLPPNGIRSLEVKLSALT